MTIPDYQSLMLPVLHASSKGEVRIGAVVEELADQLGLNLQERSELLPSGKQTVFSNRVHWAKSYLSKAQLVELTRRGHFKITARGEAVLKSPPAQIMSNFSGSLRNFVSFERDRAALTAKAVLTLFLPQMTKSKRQMKQCAWPKGRLKAR